MVAPKRGRGAKAQAAKAKPAAPAAEEPVPEAEVTDSAAAETVEENNGQEVTDAAPSTDTNNDGAAPAAASDAPAAAVQDGKPEPENKEEDKKEEKVESGKLLVENLPSNYLFDYQDRLKELFSKHGEILSIKRGPIIVTELTTTPTLSAIVEFKNKESMEKALSEEGTVLDGNRISVAIESRADTAVLVGVPYEASNEYVRLLFTQCGEVAHIHEFSKTKYKILRVTFHNAEGVERALKLDRELRVNGFLVTVSKYRDDDDQKAHNANTNKNKRQHPQNQNRNSNVNSNNSPANRNNNFRPRGGAAPFNARGNFRGGARGGVGGGGRGGFGGGRGGGAGFPRGGFAPAPPAYLPPQGGYMARPGGFMNDGQRPNKRLRQM